MKNLLKKSRDDGSDFYTSLLIYRSTPILDGKSPAELLINGRKLRSNLPMRDEHFVTSEKHVEGKKLQKAKQKHYYDKTVLELPPLAEGQVIRMRDAKDTHWAKKGVVIQQVAPRSYEIETEDGVRYRRNRKDILKSNETVLPKIDSDQYFDQYQNDNHISNHASSTFDHDQSDKSSQVNQSKVRKGCSQTKKIG